MLDGLFYTSSVVSGKAGPSNEARQAYHAGIAEPYQAGILPGHQKHLILPCHQRETRELTTPRSNRILHQNLECRLLHAAVLPALRWQRDSIQRILTFPILMMHDVDSP